MSNRPPIVLLCLLLSIAGVVLSASLLRVHAAGSGGGLVAKICGADGGCDRVISSRWSVLPPRPEGDAVTPGAERGAIPVAALGLFYFTVLGIWFAVVGRPSGDRAALHRVAIGLCCLGVASSVWYIVVMGVLVKAWCPLCLATHVVNFALLPAVVLARPRSPEQPEAGEPRADRRDRRRSGDPGALPRTWPGGLVAGLTLLLGVAVCWAEWGTYRTAAFRTEAEEAATLLGKYAENVAALEVSYFQEQQHEVNIRDDDPIIQAEQGLRMTVVYFSQPQCPHCALFERLLYDEVQPMFNGHLRIVYKHYPRPDPESVPYKAAMALEAARLQDKFWEMHAALDERRQELPRVDYAAVAKELGLDVDRFTSDMGSPAVRERIEEDIREAQRLGIRGTPAVLLNSRVLDRFMRGLPTFWQSRADALKRLREAEGVGW